MKRIISILFFVILLAAALFAWKVFGPATAFEGKNYYLLIKTGSTYTDVQASFLFINGR